MEDTFMKQYEVGARALTPNLHIRPSDVIDYFQEIATIHSQEAGYTMEWFLQHKQGWMVLTWDIWAQQYPKWMDIITVETWAPQVKKLVAPRYFNVLNADGQSIIKATSTWVYMDILARRPIKPPPEMLEKFYSPKPGYVQKVKNNFPLSTELTPLHSREFTVTRRDTDSNHHVNNVKYMQWAEDDIPDSVFNHQKAIHINIAYHKECVCGDKVKAWVSSAGEQRFYSKFSDPQTEETFVKILTQWQ